MKRQDLITHHQQSIRELKQEVTKLENDLVETRMQKNTEKLKDLKLPSKIRHNIASLKTIIRLKELTGDEEVAKPTPKPKKSTTSSKKES